MLIYIHTGSLCNSQCPDELILGEPTSNKWHIGVKLAIVVQVVGLSITCIVIKWMFFVRLHHLEKKLNSYLHSFDNKLESSNRVIPQVNRSTIWEGIPLDPPPTFCPLVTQTSGYTFASCHDNPPPTPEHF